MEKRYQFESQRYARRMVLESSLLFVLITLLALDARVQNAVFGTTDQAKDSGQPLNVTTSFTNCLSDDCSLATQVRQWAETKRPSAPKKHLLDDVGIRPLATVRTASQKTNSTTERKPLDVAAHLQADYQPFLQSIRSCVDWISTSEVIAIPAVSAPQIRIARQVPPVVEPGVLRSVLDKPPRIVHMRDLENSKPNSVPRESNTNGIGYQFQDERVEEASPIPEIKSKLPSQ